MQPHTHTHAHPHTCAQINMQTSQTSHKPIRTLQKSPYASKHTKLLTCKCSNKPLHFGGATHTETRTCSTLGFGTPLFSAHSLSLSRENPRCTWQPFPPWSCQTSSPSAFPPFLRPLLGKNCCVRQTRRRADCAAGFVWLERCACFYMCMCVDVCMSFLLECVSISICIRFHVCLYIFVRIFVYNYIIMCVWILEYVIFCLCICTGICSFLWPMFMSLYICVYSFMFTFILCV